MAVKISTPKLHKLQIEVYDKTYDVIMGESYVIDKWVGIKARAEELSKTKKASMDEKTIRSLLVDCHEFLDGMLGDGSAFEIIGTRPIGITEMVVLISSIVGAVTKGYTNKLDSYE